MQSFHKRSPITQRRRQVLLTGASLMVLSTANAPIFAAEKTPLRLAVAANFAAPMVTLAQQFERSSGIKVSISAGSTGKFYAQIRQAAPFDVLLAADTITIQNLIDEGLADPKTRLTYAIGHLALWSPEPGLFGTQAQAVEKLKAGDFTRFAIANPAVAPYGAAAQAVLKHLGLADAWLKKRVQGQSIGQTHQFVASGNAELGFVALSQIQTADQPIAGSVWQPPQNWYPLIRQDAVLLNASKNPFMGKAFLTFLASSQAQDIIKQFGFDILPTLKDEDSYGASR